MRAHGLTDGPVAGVVQRSMTHAELKTNVTLPWPLNLTGAEGHSLDPTEGAHSRPRRRSCTDCVTQQRIFAGSPVFRTDARTDES